MNKSFEIFPHRIIKRYKAKSDCSHHKEENRIQIQFKKKIPLKEENQQKNYKFRTIYSFCLTYILLINVCHIIF